MQPLARIITDSLSPSNVRLTTLIARIPRCVLAELNTHRVFSRNSASSRAIPTFKMIEKVDTDPFIPEKWGANGKGMQAHGVLSPEAEIEATRVWLELRDQMVEGAKRLAELGSTNNMSIGFWNRSSGIRSLSHLQSGRISFTFETTGRRIRG